MNAQIKLLFHPVTNADRETMRSLAGILTDNRESIRVSSDAKPNCLVVDFTMPTQPQMLALNAIDRVLKMNLDRGEFSSVSFPKTESEEASAKRKNERRKAKRRENRELRG